MHCAEVLYRGYSGAAKQSMCVFCCPANHRIALRKWNRGGSYFCAQLRDKQIFACKCKSCLHERALLTGNLFGEKPHRDEAKRNRDVL